MTRYSQNIKINFENKVIKMKIEKILTRRNIYIRKNLFKAKKSLIGIEGFYIIIKGTIFQCITIILSL